MMKLRIEKGEFYGSEIDITDKAFYDCTFVNCTFKGDPHRADFVRCGFQGGMAPWDAKPERVVEI